MTELERLTAHLREEVLALVDRIEAADGVRPVNESGALAIAGDRPATFFLESSAGQIVAFAIADHRDGTIMAGVDPEHRGHDVAEATLGAALEAFPQHTVWAFGTRPGSALLARRLGLVPVRELLKLGRELRDERSVTPPPGYTISAFAPAQAPAVVEVNAAAFAHHPEQGKLTLEEFRVLTQQPWFDPAGLLVAERDGAVAGFHWTKIHDDGSGEVYVLAVAPEHEGHGLGRALLGAGLVHLEQQGCTSVHLYVEASEERVVRMYESASFGTVSLDTSYRLKDS